MKTFFITPFVIIILYLCNISNVYASEIPPDDLPTSSITIETDSSIQQPVSTQKYTSYYETNKNGNEMGVYLDTHNPDRFDSNIVVYVYAQKGRDNLSFENVVSIGRYLDDTLNGEHQYMDIQFLINPYRYRDDATDLGFLDGELWLLQGYLLNGNYVLYNKGNCAQRFGYCYLLNENLELIVDTNGDYKSNKFLIENEQLTLYAIYADSKEWIEDNQEDFINWAKQNVEKRERNKNPIKDTVSQNICVTEDDHPEYSFENTGSHTEIHIESIHEEENTSTLPEHIEDTNTKNSYKVIATAIIIAIILCALGILLKKIIILLIDYND